MELLNKKILETEVHNENPLPLNLLILKKCFDWVELVGSSIFLIR